ncbi:MAG: DUF262 domain-containing protein [Methanobrevibacter sp.]|nr:DUF262 domain-containing protein [Methanobrevibacter sp.]
MIESKKIVNVSDILFSTNNLKIPDYQRPYKWDVKNVNQLIDDIFNHSDKSSYRLGTLVLHNDGKELNIVDGQQRILTLTLIAYSIIDNHRELLDDNLELVKFSKNDLKLIKIPLSNEISKFNIQSNFHEINRRIKEFDIKTIEFFFKKCEFVKVTLTDISEAFQFFDSQNSRGKDLDPHDLLKAFHLREMTQIPEGEKIKIVEKWENIKSEELADLFSLYLYRIRNWSKGYSARYFTKDKVDTFKGINPVYKKSYPFAKMFNITHFYIENYNESYHRSIDKNPMDYPFQLDQTIINGKRFFEMISYYKKMIDELIYDKLKESSKKIYDTLNNYPGKGRTGDRYVRNLFDCSIIYYYDKFGDEKISKAIEKMFIWAYTLRLELQNVQLLSADNHALSNRKNSINFNQIFRMIREENNPNNIINMKLNIIKKNRSTKTEDIVELFKEMNYFEQKE